MLKNKGLKMLLRIGFSFLVIGIIIFLAIFVNHIQIQKREFARLTIDHPDSIAIVAYTIDEKGEPVEDDNDLYLNADTPLVTASMLKLVVLAAYETAVSHGDLNAEELISIADVEDYYLPKTDGNAHISGLTRLGIKTDDLGFALDQNEVISLDDIAGIMIHYSGNAETDYLISRVGIENVNSIPGMEHHTPIRSILGISLVMMNHETPFDDADLRLSMVNEVAQENYGVFDQLAALYINDPIWRENQIDFMRSDQYLSAANQLGWDGQVQAGQLFPKGTAREYARLMAKIASGQLISAEVSARMQEKLETIPADWPVRVLYCKRYGSKDGLTAGLINLASYCSPKSGLLVGQMRVVVIMTNQLPVKTWSSQVNSQGIYFFQNDLAGGRGVFGELNNQN